MQANKLQFRSPGFEALPGYRRWGDDLLDPVVSVASGPTAMTYDVDMVATRPPVKIAMFYIAIMQRAQGASGYRSAT
jgi:hypothetical protein